MGNSSGKACRVVKADRRHGASDAQLTPRRRSRCSASGAPSCRARSYHRRAASWSGFRPQHAQAVRARLNRRWRPCAMAPRRQAGLCGPLVEQARLGDAALGQLLVAPSSSCARRARAPRGQAWAHAPVRTEVGARLSGVPARRIETEVSAFAWPWLPAVCWGSDDEDGRGFGQHRAIGRDQGDGDLRPAPSRLTGSITLRSASAATGTAQEPGAIEWPSDSAAIAGRPRTRRKVPRGERARWSDADGKRRLGGCLGQYRVGHHLWWAASVWAQLTPVAAATSDDAQQARPRPASVRRGRAAPGNLALSRLCLHPSAHVRSRARMRGTLVLALRLRPLHELPGTAAPARPDRWARPWPPAPAHAAIDRRRGRLACSVFLQPFLGGGEPLPALSTWS